MRSLVLVCLASSFAAADAPKVKFVDVVNTTGMYGDWAAYQGEHRVAASGGTDKLVPFRTIVQVGKVDGNVRIVWYSGDAGKETRFHARTTSPRPSPIDEIADFVAAVTKSTDVVPKSTTLESAACKAGKDVPCTVVRFTVNNDPVVVGLADGVRGLGITHLEITDAKGVKAKMHLIGYGRAKRSEWGIALPANLVDRDPNAGAVVSYGSKRPAASLVIGDAQTTGGDLDKAIIRRYVKRNAMKLTYCYEKALLAKPAIQGVVTAKFEIGASGVVSTSSATGVDPDVANCVASVIKDIEFPKPKDGNPTQVTYAFTFKPPA